MSSDWLEGSLRGRASHPDQPPSCTNQTPPFTCPEGSHINSSLHFKGEFPLHLLPPAIAPLPSASSLLISLSLSSAKSCQGNCITNDLTSLSGAGGKIHEPSPCSQCPDDFHRAAQCWTTPVMPPHPTPTISASYTLVATPGPRCKKLEAGRRCLGDNLQEMHS